MNNSLTPARFLAIVNKDTRTAADINAASAYLKRSAYQRALWAHVRHADGADGATIAEESGVTAGRISQIRYGVDAMIRAGIPMPTTVAAATAAETTYLHVSRVYKSGKEARARLKEAIERAETIADVTGKHNVLLDVRPDVDADKRAARPNDGTSAVAADDDTNNNGAPTTGATVTDRESTLVERMRAVLSDIKNGPVADIESVMALANEISDAIVARAEGADLIVAE